MFLESKAEPFPFLPEWMAAMVVREPWAEVTEILSLPTTAWVEPLHRDLLLGHVLFSLLGRK